MPYNIYKTDQGTITGLQKQHDTDNTTLGLYKGQNTILQNQLAEKSANRPANGIYFQIAENQIAGGDDRLPGTGLPVKYLTKEPSVILVAATMRSYTLPPIHVTSVTLEGDTFGTFLPTQAMQGVDFMVDTTLVYPFARSFLFSYLGKGIVGVHSARLVTLTDIGPFNSDNFTIDFGTGGN